MKETKESVISATLIDGKHLKVEVNVEIGSGDLSKLFAALAFTAAQGMKESLMKSGVDSEDAYDATWGLLGAAFATAKYDKRFAKMMNHECEVDKSEDEGVAVFAIGNDELIPDDWPECLKKLIRLSRKNGKYGRKSTPAEDEE